MTTKITDQGIVSVVDAHNGSTYLARLETSLATRFPFSTSEERLAAVQSALHRRVLIITPMGNVRTPPNDEAS
jgi:hypothetical protein